MSLSLRPYQLEAVAAIERELETKRSTLLVLPTGCGKTVVFCSVAERMRARGRVLVLAHREELLEQAVEKMHAATSLTAAIEMASRTAPTLQPPDVVVASVQTLVREKRRAKFGPDFFGIIIVDEAHHAPSASYRQVLEYFAPAKVLGVTATPDRSDGVAMGQVFESVAYSYEIRRAIGDGFLVPIRQRAVAVDGLDFSKVRTTAGDLNAGDLERILVEEEPLHGIAVPTVELAGDRPTIVFAASVEHARQLATVIDRYAPGQARAVDGTTDTLVRKRTVEAFAKGEFRFLVNCALFTEGFDVPSVACVALARPTKSRALYAQCIGRGTRLSPGKADCLVLDFRGNAGRHALVSSFDVLGGNAPASVKKRAEQLVEADPQLELLDALDEAARLEEEEAERRRRAEEEAKRRGVRWRPGYRVEDVDPFASVESLLGVQLPPFREDHPTPPDVCRFLAGHGIDWRVVTQIDADQALVLVEHLGTRRKQGLCTLRQAQALARCGVTDVAGLTFSQANARLREIAMTERRTVAV